MNSQSSYYSANVQDTGQLSRDEIAVQVLNGMYSNSAVDAQLSSHEQLARIAYAQADAMIAERDKVKAPRPSPNDFGPR